MATSAGEIPCDLAVVCTKKEANAAVAKAAGLRADSANGLIVDERMQTSAADDLPGPLLPGRGKLRVKLLAEPGPLRLIGVPSVMA